MFKLNTRMSPSIGEVDDATRTREYQSCGFHEEDEHLELIREALAMTVDLGVTERNLLWIKSISDDCSKDDIKGLLVEHGKVIYIKMFQTKDLGENSGQRWALVAMNVDINEAVLMLNGTMLKGNIIELLKGDYYTLMEREIPDYRLSLISDGSGDDIQKKLDDIRVEYSSLRSRRIQSVNLGRELTKWERETTRKEERLKAMKREFDKDYKAYQKARLSLHNDQKALQIRQGKVDLQENECDRLEREIKMLKRNKRLRYSNVGDMSLRQGKYERKGRKIDHLNRVFHPKIGIFGAVSFISNSHVQGQSGRITPLSVTSRSLLHNQWSNKFEVQKIHTDFYSHSDTSYTTECSSSSKDPSLLAECGFGGSGGGDDVGTWIESSVSAPIRFRDSSSRSHVKNDEVYPHVLPSTNSHSSISNANTMRNNPTTYPNSKPLIKGPYFA
ncbi:hypothetical protein ACOME3_009365 [Neoechinorhynchus agilis]